MKLIRSADFFDNFNYMDSFSELLGNSFANFSQNNIKHSISEDDKNYYIELDMPNVEKEKIKLEHRDHTLEISYERELKEEKKSRKYIYNSVTYGKFMNSLSLPKNANLNEMKAKYDKGILELTVPKVNPINDTKKICFIE